MSQSHTFSTVTDDGRVTSNVTEEGLNQFTHGIGLGLSLLGTIHLLSQSFTDSSVFLGCCVYCVTLVALYAASTLSHSFEDAARKTRFRTVDQVCIFLFMAGIFTPVSLCSCVGWWNLPLVLMWILAAAVCYLVGILFLVNDHRHRLFHPVWHVLVMMGSACHYVTILHYVA